MFVADCLFLVDIRSLDVSDWLLMTGDWLVVSGE